MDRKPWISSSRQRRGLVMGTDAATGSRIELDLRLLTRHLALFGRPGTGKTRAVLNLWRQFLRFRNVTPIVINFKGALGRMARDLTIAEGQAHRLLYFDPSLATNGRAPAFDPMKPNGVSIDLQAKAVRDAICGSYGDDDLSDMPQLARMMHIVLSVGRRLELNLPQTVELLYPESELRAAALRLLPSSPLKNALTYFDLLNDSRKDQIAASTVARLEGLVMDDGLRGILSQRRASLDFAQVFRERRAVIFNLELKKPFTLNDSAMFARMIVNAIVNECFAMDPKERGAVLLVIDEAALALSMDVARTLDMGRELGLWCVLSTQYPAQYDLPDGNQKLRKSVENSVGTHLYFGGLSVKDLEDGIVQDAWLDQWNEREIKDEFTSLELDPRLTWKAVPTVSVSGSTTRSRAKSKSATEGTAHTNGSARSETESKSLTTSHTHETTRGRSTGTGWNENVGGAHATTSGGSTGEGRGEAILPTSDGQSFLFNPRIVKSTTEQTSDNSSTSEVSSWGFGLSGSETDSESEGDSDGIAFGKSHATSTTENESDTESMSTTRGDTASRSESRSKGRSLSRAPFYEYDKRRNVTSRTYVSREEYLTHKVKVMRGLPQAHFVLKAGSAPARIVRAPYLPDPWVRPTRRAEVMAIVFSTYGTIAEAEQEEAERAVKLIRFTGAADRQKKKKPRGREK